MNKSNRSSGIGGQAVLEGIMMRNKDRYAVAVRKPDGDIAVDVRDYPGLFGKKAWTGLPFIRGVFSFIDSLVLGLRTLTWSAEFYEDEESEAKKSAREAKEQAVREGDADTDKEKGSIRDKIFTAGTIVFSILFAIALFMLLPMYCAKLLENLGAGTFAVALAEGLLRMVIFIAYVWGISLMEDIRRTYMYHGAEHKCINCIEDHLPLTVENVRKSSRLHKRCGTSFLMFVMLISIILFLFLQFDNLLMRTISRILLVPVIAGISYELLKLAGNSDSGLINLISAPGLMLQRLTTREPEDDMIEVAIRAVEEVFDWRSFQQGEEGKPSLTK